MSVGFHQSQERNFWRHPTYSKSIFLRLNMFLPEEVFSYIHDSTISVFSLPFTSLSVFDVLHNRAFGHAVFSEIDERKWFIHQTRPGIQIPADLLIRWLILQILLGAGAGPRLLGLYGRTWCTGHHLSCSDSVWQQIQTGLSPKNEHIASSNSNVKHMRDCKGWLHDTRVRPRLSDRLLPYPVFIKGKYGFGLRCVLACIWGHLAQVNVSHQNL